MSDIPEDCPGIGSEEAGNSSQCNGCPNQSNCQSGEVQVDPNIPIIAGRLSAVKTVLLVLSGKGGVGKSTVAAQLAFEFARDPNKQVGLLDIDICGPSQPHLMSLSSEEVHTSASGWSPVFHETYPNLGVMSIGFLIPSNDDPIIWRGPRKNGLIKQFLSDVDWGELDYLIIDCPPGTSDEHLSIVTFLSGVPQTVSIVVTTPHALSYLDVRKEIGFCRKTGMKMLGVVENMSGFFCQNCEQVSNIFSTHEASIKMCNDMGVKLLCSIPMDGPIAVSTNEGVPLPDESKSRQRFSELVERVTQELKNQ